MGADEILDTRGRGIEAAGEAGYLIAALDFHPRRQIARTEQFDSFLKALEPPRDAPRQRKCGQRHGDRNAAGKEEKTPF